MSDLYILDDQGKPIPCDDMGTWARWIETNLDKKIISQDTYPDGTLVSTVFLGMNHSWTGGLLIYETMIFAGSKLSNDLDQYQTRASTREEAVEQHMEACKLVEESLKGVI